MSIHAIGTLSAKSHPGALAAAGLTPTAPTAWSCCSPDVGGNGTNPYVGEDPDTLRFRDEAAANLGVPLINLRDGRDIWDVFEEHSWLGNSRLAHCSWDLKTQPARNWMDANAQPGATVIVGISVMDAHRMPQKTSPLPALSRRGAPAGHSRRCGSRS